MFKLVTFTNQFTSSCFTMQDSYKIQSLLYNVRSSRYNRQTLTHWGPSQSSWAARGPAELCGPRSWIQHCSGRGTHRSSGDFHRSWSWNQHRHHHAGTGGGLWMLEDQKRWQCYHAATVAISWGEEFSFSTSASQHCLASYVLFRLFWIVMTVFPQDIEVCHLNFAFQALLEVWI